MLVSTTHITLKWNGGNRDQHGWLANPPLHSRQHYLRLPCIPCKVCGVQSWTTTGPTIWRLHEWNTFPKETFTVDCHCIMLLLAFYVTHITCKPSLVLRPCATHPAPSEPMALPPSPSHCSDEFTDKPSQKMLFAPAERIPFFHRDRPNIVHHGIWDIGDGFCSRYF